MKQFFLILIILCQIGCRDKPTETATTTCKAIEVEKSHELSWLADQWTYDGTAPDESKLKELINSQFNLQLNAPKEMQCKHLKIIWEGCSRDFMSLNLSLSNTTKSTEKNKITPSLTIIKRYGLGLFNEDLMSITLKESGIFINNKELLTQAEFQKRMNDLYSMAKSSGNVFQFHFMVDDELSFGKLYEFLQENEGISFSISILDSNKQFYELNRPIPPSSTSQDLLHREPKGKIY